MFIYQDTQQPHIHKKCHMPEAVSCLRKRQHIKARHPESTSVPQVRATPTNHVPSNTKAVCVTSPDAICHHCTSSDCAG